MNFFLTAQSKCKWHGWRKYYSHPN